MMAFAWRRCRGGEFSQERCVGVAQAIRSRLLIAKLLALVAAAALVRTQHIPQQPLSQHEYCIIGAGPAGLQMGFFLQLSGRDYVILERGPSSPKHFRASIGAARTLLKCHRSTLGHSIAAVRALLTKRPVGAAGIKSALKSAQNLAGRVHEFFRTFPRHRRLISINKRHTGRGGSALASEYNLRHDWHSLLSGVSSGVIDERSLFNSLVTDTHGLYPSADSLAEYGARWAELWKLNIRTQCKVTRVLKSTRVDVNLNFELEVQQVTEQPEPGVRRDEPLAGAEAGLVGCRWVILATGLFKPHIPDLLGLAQNSISYNDMPSATAFFANKTVGILGGGNAAFETWKAIMHEAAYVHVHAPSELQLAYETHYVGHVRAVNAAPIDNYLLKSQDALHVPSPLGLSKDDTVVGMERSAEDGRPVVCLKDRNHDAMAARFAANPQERLLDGRGRDRDASHSLSYTERFRAVDRYCYDVLIRCTGFDWDDSVFSWPVDSEGGRRGSKYPTLDAQWQLPSAPGLYVIGALAHMRDKPRRSAGGFVHGFRYTARALFKWLEQKHHSVPWPRSNLTVLGGAKRGAGSGALARRLFERMDTSSGLYQMFGELADVVLLPAREDGPGRVAQYLEEVPLDLLAAIVHAQGAGAAGAQHARAPPQVRLEFLTLSTGTQQFGAGRWFLNRTHTTSQNGV